MALTEYLCILSGLFIIFLIFLILVWFIYTGLYEPLKAERKRTPEEQKTLKLLEEWENTNRELREFREKNPSLYKSPTKK